MLPDFLKTKEKLKKRLNYAMQQAHILNMGPLADIPTSMFFEGSKTIIIREDGSVVEMNPKKMTVELEINLAEIAGMSHEMLLEKIYAMGEEMAGKQAKLSYDVMSKAAEEVGNVTSSDGKPLTIELILDAIEKMHIDFDKEGKPSGLTFVANPKLYPSLAKVMSQTETDPRFHALMERKKEEWCVRENNRKLVG